MDTKKIGTFIARCRKDKQMTQKQLAEQLGVSDKSISKWERGINLPESTLFMPLCQCLGIQVQELLLGEKIQEEALLKKSNELIVDLSRQKDKEALLSYQMLIFFVLLPAILYLIISFFNHFFYSPANVLFYFAIICPFIFIYHLIKAIECIQHNKSYFLHFIGSSFSLFFILLYFFFL
jgi:Predicted transcriptional regulators